MTTFIISVLCLAVGYFVGKQEANDEHEVDVICDKCDEVTERVIERLRK